MQQTLTWGHLAALSLADQSRHMLMTPTCVNDPHNAEASLTSREQQPLHVTSLSIWLTPKAKDDSFHDCWRAGLLNSIPERTYTSLTRKKSYGTPP